MCKDRVVGVFFVLLCAILWFYLIPQHIKGDTQTIYPRLVTIFLVIPALFMLLRSSKHEAKNIPTQNVSVALPKGVVVKLLWLILGYVVYLFCVAYVGFFVASFAFGILCMRFFGEKRLRKVLCIPVSVLAAIYFFIVFCLKYPLPSGILF